MIVLLHAPDPEFSKEAPKRGVFAHINDDGVEDWQSSIDIVLRRFAEYRDLEGAFGRRALTERANGTLMERHSIGEDSAFEMLREQSRVANRRLIDLAAPSSTATVYSPRKRRLPPRREAQMWQGGHLRRSDCRKSAPVWGRPPFRFMCRHNRAGGAQRRDSYVRADVSSAAWTLVL